MPRKLAHRSVVSGQFVTAKEARTQPKRTQLERIVKPAPNLGSLTRGEVKAAVAAAMLSRKS